MWVIVLLIKAILLICLWVIRIVSCLLYTSEGKNVPCTVIEAGPCVVTQVKTLEKDGYEAVQLGDVYKRQTH